MKFLFGLFLLPGLVVGLTVHEAAHALSAKWLGDHNPERMGRVSLNPFRHMSALGTVVLFVLGFGWGKPVEVNLYNFRRPKLYFLLSSLAGPVSNLLICGLSLGVMYGAVWLVKSGLIPWFGKISFLIVYGAAMSCYLVNGMLAAVNLLPIPPLDGSKIWPCIIPGMRPTLSGKWSKVSSIILIVALMTGMVGKIISPTISWMQRLMPHAEYMAMKLDFPAFMTPPNRAMNRQFSRLPRDSRDPNALICHYTIDDTNPFTDTTSYYDSLLAQHGWSKLSYDLKNPHESADKWVKDTAEADSDKPEQTRFYNKTYWVNEANEVVAVILQAGEDALSEDLPTEIDVWQVWYCNDVAMRRRAEEYRTLHPEQWEKSPTVIRSVKSPSDL